MKKYHDLFIDFDDTLYDTYGNAVISLRQLYADFALGRYFADEQKFYDTYWRENISLWQQYAKGEITRDYLIVERFRRPLTTGHGLNVTKELCLEMSDRFLDLCASKPGVVEGAHELMDYLRGRGYSMHICSNGFHEVQYRKLDACGLREYFDTVILSEDAGANKPSPVFFGYALQTTGATPETTLMIGDNLQGDILGALGVGIDAMLFNRWSVDVGGQQQQPTFVVDRLSEIMSIL